MTVINVAKLLNSSKRYRSGSKGDIGWSSVMQKLSKFKAFKQIPPSALLFLFVNGRVKGYINSIEKMKSWNMKSGTVEPSITDHWLGLLGLIWVWIWVRKINQNMENLPNSHKIWESENYVYLISYPILRSLGNLGALTQNPPGFGLCEFDSRLRHELFRGFSIQGFKPPPTVHELVRR